MRDATFCLRCGAALVHEAGARPRCSHCDFVLYQDPKVAVAAVIATDEGILLGRRAIDPGLGLWSFPSGYMDRGERAEEALRREVREELGVDIGLDGLVGVYSEASNPVLLIVYAAHLWPGSGPLALNHENSEVAAFAPDAFPPMAFSHDRQIVADWQRLRSVSGATR